MRTYVVNDCWHVPTPESAPDVRIMWLFFRCRKLGRNWAIFLAPGVAPSLINESTHVKFFRCVESTNTAANILSLPGIPRNFEHLHASTKFEVFHGKLQLYKIYSHAVVHQQCVSQLSCT